MRSCPARGGQAISCRALTRAARMAAGRRRSARSRGSEGSLPEPDPENRAAISIRSARPPIITVMSGLAAPDHHPLPALAAEVIVGGWPFPLDLPAGAPRLKWLHQRPAGGAKGSHLPDQLLRLAAMYRTWRSRNVGEPFIAGMPVLLIPPDCRRETQWAVRASLGGK